MGPDGAVYYGLTTYSGAVPSVVETPNLVARSPDGQILWMRPLAGGVGRVAVADDGTLRVLSGGRSPELHALASDGSERWSLPVPSGVMAVGADGTAYLAVSGGVRAGGVLKSGELWAVGPDGRVRWIYRGRLDGSYPVVGGDGMIYVGGSPLVALRPDGSRAWSFPATSTPLAPQAIGTDGTLYATAAGAERDYALPQVNLALAGPSAPARVVLPRLSAQRGLLAGVRLSPTRFRLGGAVSLCPAPGQPCRPAHPLGAVLRYTLRRESALVIVVRRARDGKVMSRLVRRAHPGITWRSLADAADSKPLTPGRYTLTMRAAAGRARAVVGPLRFTVVPSGA